MSAASNFTENAVLDHVLGNTTYTPASALYLGLFTGSTNLEANDLGTASDEVSTSGTAYSRKAITFNASSGGTASSAATVTFDTAIADWGTVTHVAVMDAATGGNVLFYGSVTTSREILAGDTFQVSAGNLTISLA